MRFKIRLFSLVISLLPLQLIAKDCESTSRTFKDGDFSVHTLSFSDAKSSRHILIIPPTGGTNFLDRNWAKNFCKQGFTSHIIEHWSDDDEKAYDLGIHQRFYSRTQKAIELVLSNIKSGAYVGILGTSIGGIHTAMAMGIHDRLNAAFVIAGGAGMASMIANSDQDAMINAWNKRKELLKLPNKEVYIQKLSEAIIYEPLKLPRKFQGKDLGMIISTKDTTVPYANQLLLKNHWNPKKIIKYKFDHFWTIFLSWLWDSDSVIEFFKKSAEGEKSESKS